MSDLKKYVADREKRDQEFAEGFDEGYARFKIGATLREAREVAGLSQEELATLLRTKKTAISRIELGIRGNNDPSWRLPSGWRAYRYLHWSVEGGTCISFSFSTCSLMWLFPSDTEIIVALMSVCPIAFMIAQYDKFSCR